MRTITKIGQYGWKSCQIFNMNFAPECEFEFKTLLTPLDTTAAAQKIPLQGCKGKFEPDKAQYSTPIFFWPVVYYKSISKPKIYARPRPWGPCQQWRPCLCRRRKEDQEIEKKERNKIAFLFPFLFGKIYKNSPVVHAKFLLLLLQRHWLQLTYHDWSKVFLKLHAHLKTSCPFTLNWDVSEEVGSRLSPFVCVSMPQFEIFWIVMNNEFWQRQGSNS